MRKSSSEEAPWDRERPEGKKKTALTPEWRQKAKKRAREAGRKYPNLVDNLWAATEQGKRKGVKKKAAGAKKTGSTNRARSTNERAAARKTGGAKKTARAT